LCAAIEDWCRYDTIGPDGTTRRERNEDFGRPELSPEIDVPEDGAHLWAIYHEVSSSINRIHDGRCSPISPVDFTAWVNLTGTIVSADEYGILQDMDRAYIKGLNIEIAAYEAAAQQGH